MGIKPPTTGEDLNTVYDDAFFKSHEPFRPAYAHLAGLIRELSPADAASVVDIGCGHCILLEELGKHFNEARGIDGSLSGIPLNLRDRVMIVNMAMPGWGAPVTKKTDVVVSLETGEHLPKEASDEYVETLIGHRPSLIVFSAATVYQDSEQNPTHINEQPLSYWVDKFERRGYVLSPQLSMTLRAKMMDSKLYSSVGWYLKNTLVFVAGASEAFSFTAQPFIYSSNPVHQLIFERDRLEFENLVLKRLTNLKGKNL